MYVRTLLSKIAAIGAILKRSWVRLDVENGSSLSFSKTRAHELQLCVDYHLLGPGVIVDLARLVPFIVYGGPNCRIQL